MNMEKPNNFDYFKDTLAEHYKVELIQEILCEDTYREVLDVLEPLSKHFPDVESIDTIKVTSKDKIVIKIRPPYDMVGYVEYAENQYNDRQRREHKDEEYYKHRMEAMQDIKRRLQQSKLIPREPTQFELEF